MKSSSNWGSIEKAVSKIVIEDIKRVKAAVCIKRNNLSLQ
jgi:hypothetical protein